MQKERSLNPPGPAPAGGLPRSPSDRFFLGILVAIALLVALALSLYFVRRGSLRYGPEDTPRGVVRNYLLALHNGDYERAYSYLVEGELKPDFEHFQEAFLDGTLEIANVAVQVGQMQINGGQATVALTLIHTGRDPVEEVYRESAVAQLKLVEGGNWKVTSLPAPYWVWDWYHLGVAKPGL